ncbi:MAG: AAA family ATPase [Rhizobiales bacterium]|nr:AAA family ATPase [Hyphomicrobiales bacterium]
MANDAKSPPTDQESMKPLPPASLRRETDERLLGFKTTAEIEPLSGFFGQDRAVNAMEFGTSIRQPGYNLFALGPATASRRLVVSDFLRGKACQEPAPDDWVYVNNFDEPRRPRAIRLPSGRAAQLRDDMNELVGDLAASVPSLFESEEYKTRRRAADEVFETAQEKAFEELQEKANAQNIAIMRTPMGFAFAPTKNGQIVKPEVFNELPEAERKEVQEKIGKLQDELKEVLEIMPLIERDRRKRVRELNAEMAKSVIEISIREVTEHFKDIPAVLDFLKAVARDLVDNVDIFLKQEQGREESMVAPAPLPPRNDPRFRRYLVNVMVSSAPCAGEPGRGAPVILEENPTLANLVGRIEHVAQMGALITDFTLIQPGALHKANGGYLVVDARAVLLQPFTWEALKRALKTGVVKIESAAEQMSLVSTVSLEPDPIPLSVKVVLVGERQLYYTLAEFEPDFPKLFKVQVDFEDEAERSPENLNLFARFTAAVVRDWGLRPADAGAVARLSDEASRLADDNERISLHTSALADLVREADHWAGVAKSDIILREHVERAVTERIYRADRIREKSHEMIARGIVLVDVDGEKVGQINGLSVLGIGDFRFGKPSRITARVRLGAGKVIDIEREVELGGPIHSKGVLILASFLAARYALDEPPSLSASLVFEQSYGGVEGDSASCAELFSLISALSDVPIRQSFAVTGSVNQMGEVQAIGGVNEKIEGFFDICRASGLTGRQGAIIPASNVKHLMLRPDIVAAAEAGLFHVYAIDHVDQGIELLTGRKAGMRGADGHFEAGTINALVEERLLHYARLRRRYGLTASAETIAESRRDE